MDDIKLTIKWRLNSITYINNSIFIGKYYKQCYVIENKVFSLFISHSWLRYLGDILKICEHSLRELRIFTITINNFMIKYMWTIS